MNVVGDFAERAIGLNTLLIARCKWRMGPPPAYPKEPLLENYNYPSDNRSVIELLELDMWTGHLQSLEFSQVGKVVVWRTLNYSHTHSEARPHFVCLTRRLKSMNRCSFLWLTSRAQRAY